MFKWRRAAAAAAAAASRLLYRDPIIFIFERRQHLFFLLLLLLSHSILLSGGRLEGGVGDQWPGGDLSRAVGMATLTITFRKIIDIDNNEDGTIISNNFCSVRVVLLQADAGNK